MRPKRSATAPQIGEKMKSIPPVAVPRAIAPALSAMTHIGTLNTDRTPPETKPIVMIPIVFCASFVPCDSANATAVMI